MSTQYAGDPDNVTTPIERTIIDVSNTTPCVVQTSANHGYSTGDFVEVTGLAAPLDVLNVGWRITVTALDTFELDGSVASGVYAGTAQDRVRDWSLTPAMTQPADGDLRSAASVNLAIDLLEDKAQFLGRRTRMQKHTWTASGTMVVPDDVFFIDFDLCGGGGGGGGGAGSGGVTSGNAPGGGGSLVHHIRCAVVPGETLTIAIGAGGAGGAGGAIGAVGGFGGHGGDTTITGSISGLLATAKGAVGAVPGPYASAGFCMGGLPYQHASAYHTSGILGYFNRGVYPVTAAGGFYITSPLPGQGGHVGGNAEYKQGGGTQVNAGSYAVTFAGDGTGGGGSSEWPGGIGGAGVSANAFNKGPAGNPGAGPGAGGAGGGEGVSAHAGGAGGAGIAGACTARYSGNMAVFT